MIPNDSTTRTQVASKEATFEKVSPDLLMFDETNPRFGGTVSAKGQLGIQKYLFNAPNYASELVDSLLTNGFIQYEPLIVKKDTKGYVVVEGNRRLAAIKEIRTNLGQYKKPNGFLETIPVLIFPASDNQATRIAMRVYLGVRHLVGFREWPSYSKAHFLDNESKLEGGLDKVLNEVRLSKQKARRYLVPYRLLESANVDLGEDDFWKLGEALQRAEIKKYIQLDVSSKDLTVRDFDRRNFLLLLDDLYGPQGTGDASRNTAKRRITDTRDLSSYASVLTSPKAAKTLRAGKTLEEALIHVDTREQSVRKLSNATRNVGILIRKVATDSTREEDKQVLQAYRTLEIAVKGFIKSNA